MRTLAILFACATFCHADEGMWTFDNLPVKQLQQKYHFTPTTQWLEKVRLASVRFNDGGSGSFVSPTGLVLTNHHVASGQLQKMSSATKDYLKDGFYAASQQDEMKTPDLEINVLMSYENVTEHVRSSEKPGMSGDDLIKARKQVIAAIEKDSLDKTGLRSDVVSLYHGGEYWLYRYKKYTDIRLVFAPERQAAFFGGDPDNFTYPRYDLDFALFRIYENGQPVKSDHFLRFNTKGAADGELVFVSGHPGSTDREMTVSQLESLRDFFLPQTLDLIDSRLQVLRRYAAQGPEQARQTVDMVLGLENSFKAFTGEYAGLKDPAVFAKKQSEEKQFRDAVKANPELAAKYGDVWDTLAGLEAKARTRANDSYRSLGTPLASTALQIVQYVSEVKKPEGDRLPGYRGAQSASLLRRLLSPAPVYLPLQQALMTGSLQRALAKLGPDDPWIKAVLGNSTPEQVAKMAIGGTHMADPAFRKSLIDGGEAAVQSSTDPLIVLVRKIDPFVREQTRWRETEIQSKEVPAVEKLAEARFALYGKSSYPDATFTLRLSYGAVAGYKMNGTMAPPKTTFYGLFDRAASFDSKEPFDIAPKIMAKRYDLDLSTPFDFVCTADIVGGNSGSPVINKNAELVGLIFDGNIESLVGAYVYDEATNRAVSVHPAAIVMALRKVYGAGALADELGSK